MPEFLFNNKLYYNSVEFVIDRIGGAWKMPILWRLKEGTQRFSELKKTIPYISDKMLATKLRELEKEGFIDRIVYAQVPPKVEYKLTKRGIRSIDMIQAIRLYGFDLMKEFRVESSKIKKQKKL